MGSKRIKGITIEIAGDSTKLEKSLSEVNSKLGSTNTALRDVNKLLKMDPSNTELLSQKQKLLSDAISQTKEKLEQLKIAAKEAEKMLADGTLSQEKYDALQREIIETENKLKSLQNTVGSGSAKLAEFSAKAGKVGDKLESVGKKLMPMSAAFTALGAGITKASIDFEDAFAGVTKTVDGTDEQLEKIRQGIIDLSESTTSSAVDIAAVAEAAGQLGIATDDILNFTETMVMLGDTTNITADEAASALAKFSNITGTAAEDYSRLGSTIVDLGNNFATTENDIVTMSTRLASAGTLAGLTEPEIFALATAMSSVGIEAEAGGTAMTQTLTAMEMAVANNSEKLEKFAAVANMTSSEFTKAWENDPIIAIQSFIKGLGELDEKGESATLVLDELGLTGIRQSNMLKALGLASDTLSDSITVANSAWEENTALQNEAKKRYETTASKLKQVKATLVEVAVNLGDELLPIIKNFADKLKEATEKFNKMSPAGKKMTLTIIGIGAAIGPALTSIGKMSQGISSLTGWMSKSNESSKTSFATLMKNPYVAVAGAAVGLTATIWQVVESINAETKAAKELSEENEKQIASIESQGQHAEFYMSQIEELASKEEKSASEKQLMQTYVDKLNESMEGLNVTYDAEKDQLNQTTEAIRNKIKARQDEMFADAYLEQSKEALEKYAEAQIKVTELEQRRATAQEKLEQLKAEGRTTSAQDQATIEELTGKIENFDNELNDLNESQILYIEEANKASNAAMMQSGAFDELLNEAGILKENLPKSLVEALNTGKYTLPQTVDELNALISFQKAVDSAGEDGKELADKLSFEISTGKISVQDAISKLNSAAIDEAGKLPPEGKTIGYNFGVGITKGISTSMSLIKSAAAGAVGAAVKAAKDKADIKSPSKVFRDQVGLMIGEGLAIGIEKSIPEVNKAALKLSEATLLPFLPPKITPTISTTPQDILTATTKQESNIENNVTVMIGNKEFKGYIVDTASKGISDIQRRNMKAKGQFNV